MVLKQAAADAQLMAELERVSSSANVMYGAVCPDIVE